MLKSTLSQLIVIVFVAVRIASAQDSNDSKQSSSDKTSAPEITIAGDKKAPVRMPFFESRPQIDGSLDDEIWKSATVLKDFFQTQPGDNIAPSFPTEVLIGYDSKNLFIGFRAFDEAGKVRATIAQRDDVSDDDNVSIYLDTFDDRRRAYYLQFNPLGIQGDAIFTEGSGNDFSYDIVMESKGVVTNNGYTVEVMIPFKSLRYEAGKNKLWGVQIFREIKRLNNEEDSWMPLSRDKSGLLSQSGFITGLSEISTERTIEIIPGVVLSESGEKRQTLTAAVAVGEPPTAGFRFLNRPVKSDFGLNLKYTLTPALTLDMAINPDFAQVEADETVVTANQRFPIFFPEKRPFFLEGIEIFQTPVRVVNTRTIVDPDVAVKITGKRRKTTFGLLFASDNAPGNFSEDERNDPDTLPFIEPFLDKNSTVGVFRFKQDVGRESSLGGIVTSYDFAGRFNRLFGFDGRIKTNQKTYIDFQILGTVTKDDFFKPDTGNVDYRVGRGFGYYLLYNNQGRNWTYRAQMRGLTSDYRANVGFTTRVNNNRHDYFVQYRSNPKPGAKLIFWQVYNSLRPNFDFQGRLQNWTDETQVFFSLKNQTSLGAGATVGYERLFEEEFGPKRSLTNPGTFIGNDNERSSNQSSFYVFGGSNPNKKIAFNFISIFSRGTFDFDFGAGPKFPRVSRAALTDPFAALDPGAGDAFDFSGDVTYQPTDALRFSLAYIKSRLKRDDTGLTAFDANIFSFKANYQFTRFIFLRTKTDYDSISSSIRGQYLVGWTPRPGTAFYAGYNDDIVVNGFNRFNGLPSRGLDLYGRTFFIKLSYLFRKSF